LESCSPENLEHVVILGNIGSGIRIVGYEEMISKLSKYGNITYAEVKVEKEFNTQEIIKIITLLNIERAIKKEEGSKYAFISIRDRIREKATLYLMTIVCIIVVGIYLHSLYSVQCRINEIL
jgi:hypothetical protein